MLAQEGVPAMAQRIPGAALSPDGRTLAIVDAEADRVTLIDAERLAVERVVDVRPHGSWLDWLPLRAAVAHAKGPLQGRMRQATFSADGRYLYVYGVEMTPKPDNPDQAESTGLGMTAFDLARGTIAASGLAGQQVFNAQAAPDGSVYLTSEADPGGSQARFELLHVDGHNLHVLATRVTGTYLQFEVTAA